MLSTTIDLQRITADIWITMFGLEVAPLYDAPDHHRDERVVTGIVQLTGDLEAAVIVQCSEQLAKVATATMFGLDVPEVQDDDVSDCVGELANMTGGNVKSALGGSSQLSLPSVTTGRDYQVSVRGSRITERTAFDYNGELLVVALLQREGSRP